MDDKVTIRIKPHRRLGSRVDIHTHSGGCEGYGFALGGGNSCLRKPCGGRVRVLPLQMIVVVVHTLRKLLWQFHLFFCYISCEREKRQPWLPVLSGM